jgi:hypothetical protein
VALGKDELFRYDDPLGALNLTVMTAGDELELDAVLAARGRPENPFFGPA